MTVIGVDDTDSREGGMCTTYAAALVAERAREEATVSRALLVRLNPAVPYKTRGNAALAVHTDLDPERALDLAAGVLDEEAMAGDDRTNPGLVVAGGEPDAVPDAVADWSRRALREHLDPAEARDLADAAGFRTRGWGDGRGLVGALAAVGAFRAFDEWTREVISYRERDRWGTERDVDRDSVFAAAEREYPAVWDTVDRETGTAVCVPRTPCPVLHGIRGDDPDACLRVARAIDSEPVARRETFLTNQGTDAHLADGSVAAVRAGRAYRLDGTVATAPETREGGHVFFALAAGRPDEAARSPANPAATLACAAFEPTGRFRDRVRALRVGDELTVCGEVADRRPDGMEWAVGTLKLEKFAVRDLDATELVTPTCEGCGRRMESAGADQGYRCRDCGTAAPGKVERCVERDLDPGWYEVPPEARRHVARPLVRGGFDAPVHPER